MDTKTGTKKTYAPSKVEAHIPAQDGAPTGKYDRDEKILDKEVSKGGQLDHIGGGGDFCWDDVLIAMKLAREDERADFRKRLISKKVINDENLNRMTFPYSVKEVLERAVEEAERK